ncbi:MAG: hypothetical protein Q8L66_13025 [Caulobacter sp.]|nr:hypothetical protein [Caulobacter sp.]
MQSFLGALFKAMPLIFGLGFMAPLIGQSLALTGWPMPGGIAPIWIGLAIGAVWGGVATRTGRWL